MVFETTFIEGVWRVLLEPHHDARGFFARAFCSTEFREHGLQSTFEQVSISNNSFAGTLRGLHYRPHPFSETKFVRCVRGAIFDVAVDLRPGSPTLGKWFGEVLSAENGAGLYLAPGLAHGFQTIVDNTDVLYHITPPYRKGPEDRVRWNDTAFSISWPLTSPILSTVDANCADWKP